MPRIALVHALRDSMPPLDAAFAQQWPAAVTTHLFDSSLYVDRSRNTAGAAEIQRRITELLRYAKSTGAEAMLFTGSFFGAAVEAGREGLGVPVLTSFDALVEAAFSMGRRFAVVSTAKDSAPLLTADLKRYAEANGLTFEAEERVAAGAMDALFAGDLDRHDAMIAEAAASAGPCDAVLLAQFSMTRAADLAREWSGKRVLTAPDAAVTKLKQMLGG
jgi:hypothetical protein